MRKSTAALLDNGTRPRAWIITLETTQGDQVSMQFNNRYLAQHEYNRIRSAGVFGGSWLKAIDLEEKEL